MSRWVRLRVPRVAALLTAALLGWSSARAGDVIPANAPEAQGVAMHRIFDVQVTKAAADGFVLYELEWKDATADLTLTSRAHLERLIRRLPNVPFPVIIQVHPDDAVNQTRRAVVVGALIRSGIPNAETRVVVAPPNAEGLYGDEAVILYPAMITTRFRNFGRGGGGAFRFGGVNGFNNFGNFGNFGFGGGFGGGYGYGPLGFGLYGGYGGYGYGGYGGGVVPGFRGLGY